MSWHKRPHMPPWATLLSGHPANGWRVYGLNPATGRYGWYRWTEADWRALNRPKKLKQLELFQ